LKSDVILHLHPLSLLRLIEAPDFSYRACRSRCVEAWYAEVASAKDAIYIYLQTKHQNINERVGFWQWWAGVYHKIDGPIVHSNSGAVWQVW